MKYLQTYETINRDLKKHELILIMSTHSNYDYDLFILLKDVPKSKRALDVFHIAEITFDKSSVWFEVDNLDEERTYKSIAARLLHENEQYLLFDNIYNSTKNRIVDRTKDVMGIDIKETEDYKNFLVKKEANKYNL